MKADQQFCQLLDSYARGLLSPGETRQLREKMDRDPELRKEAEAYLELMRNLRHYGDRRKIKDILQGIDAEINSTGTMASGTSAKSGGFQRYWRLTAAAAAVTVVAVVGTMLITQSLGTRQEAYYKELRRNVQQIQQSQKQIMDDLAESKEREIIPGRYSGSGFLISPNGYLATSYHVVKESDSVAIENDAYGRLRAEVVYSDATSDISILRISSPGFKLKRALPFTIRRREADPGEYVYTLGYPREDIVFGEGSVSASTGFRQDPNAYQISVPVNPGNSGGPLLNSSGDLVGMVSGVQTETSGAAFAIKSPRLFDLVTGDAVDTLSVPLTLSRQNTIRNASRVQQVKRLREFVFLVRVYKEK